MMMTVQYLDMLKEVGSNQPTALYLEHSPSSVSEVQKQINEGMKNISVASFLHEGVPVVKISHSKLGKLRKRVLTLSEDHTSLFLTHSKLAKGTRNIIPKQPAWTPSKGWNGTYIRSVDVANICDFQVGIICFVNDCPTILSKLLRRRISKEVSRVSE